MARNFLALAWSGVIAALGFALLASNRLPGVEAIVAIEVIAFVQWEILVVTAAKFGFDQLSYAIAAQNKSQTIDLQFLFSRVVLPIALCTSILISFLVTMEIAAAVFLAALADSLAAIIIGDLNGRGDHSKVAKGNLLNYPVFFALLLAMQFITQVPLEMCLALFVVTSWARYFYFAWLRLLTSREAHAQRPVGILSLGCQQISNLLLFRGDQIVLSALVFGVWPSVWKVEELSQYVFYSKFFDAVSAVWVLVGVVTFRKNHLVAGSIGRQLKGLFAERRLVVVAILSVTVGTLFLYSLLYKGTLSVWGAAGFVCMVSLVFPANLFTHSMIRARAFGALLINQSLAIAFGILAVVAVVTQSGSIWCLVAVMVLQLLMFMAFCILRSWSQ